MSSQSGPFSDESLFAISDECTPGLDVVVRVILSFERTEILLAVGVVVVGKVELLCEQFNDMLPPLPEQGRLVFEKSDNEVGLFELEGEQK